VKLERKVMPPKRKCPANKCPANKKAEECAVCCQKVTEGEGEALFCEGKCQKWLHRYCAGVSVAQFQDLSTASAPFLCVMCYQQSHGVALEELRATVTALTSELCAALQRVEARGVDALPSPPTENNEPWHTATRRKKRNKKGNNAGKSEAGAPALGTNQQIMHAQSINVQRTAGWQALVNHSKKELVRGARHIGAQ